MGSSNNEMADKQAKILEQTYKFGWMDGYGEGYDDAMEDRENEVNMLENENELIRDQLDAKDQLIDELASNAGKSLRAVKRR